MLATSQARRQRILLQGPPKIGKTTVVERLVARFGVDRVPIGGFLTSELCEHGRRVGFIVRDFHGHEATLAHEELVTGVQVGRFSVDVPAFERIAIPALSDALEHHVVLVVDEIARMELASARFVELLDKLMNEAVRVVATVHLHKHPVTDALVRRQDVEVIQVTEANRDGLPADLAVRLTAR